MVTLALLFWFLLCTPSFTNTNPGTTHSPSRLVLQFQFKKQLVGEKMKLSWQDSSKKEIMMDDMKNVMFINEMKNTEWETSFEASNGEGYAVTVTVEWLSTCSLTKQADAVYAIVCWIGLLVGSEERKKWTLDENGVHKDGILKEGWKIVGRSARNAQDC